MNRKFLLAYILFFISINAMAALASVDCKTATGSISVHIQQEHQLQCSNTTQTEEDNFQKVDEVSGGSFTNLRVNKREQPSGSLTFILLIPALLVFIFSGFEKSNK